MIKVKITKEEFFKKLDEGKKLSEIAREAGYSEWNVSPGHWRKWVRCYKQKNPGFKAFSNGKATSEVQASTKTDHDQNIFFSAAKQKEDGTVSIMGIEEYCEYYGLDYSTVHSSKLIKHSGGAYYNIHFVEKQNNKKIEDDSKKGIEQTKELLEKWIGNNREKNFIPSGINKVGVAVISDLHLGALVTNLAKTPDYSKEICMEYLRKASERINNFNYDVVHTHILGDLVETVSGLNHPNSWQSIGPGDHGARIIQTASQILHDCFLSRINNLGTVKIVSGNHDRLSANKELDVDQGGASLVAWGLGLMGYHTECHPVCIRHEVDGLCYVLLHGDRGVSKRPTKEIVWDYGKQGMFNIILEGHLHTRQERVTDGKNSSLKHLTSSDSIDTRRFICPSFFTGNFYSEVNNWFSTPGFKIFENNGKGKPNVFDFCL